MTTEYVVLWTNMSLFGLLFVIEKLINRGLIKVDDKNEFFLTREMLEIILIMIRAGLL